MAASETGLEKPFGQFCLHITWVFASECFLFLQHGNFFLLILFKYLYVGTIVAYLIFPETCLGDIQGVDGDGHGIWLQPLPRLLLQCWAPRPLPLVSVPNSLGPWKGEAWKLASLLWPFPLPHPYHRPLPCLTTIVMISLDKLTCRESWGVLRTDQRWGFLGYLILFMVCRTSFMDLWCM